MHTNLPYSYLRWIRVTDGETNMSESDEFLSDEDNGLDPNIRAELRKSRERAREAETAKAELEALKRDLAFTKAGVPETGVGALLRKAYDGDTDPDAIRKAAEEYGITGASHQEQNGELDEVREELERHRNIAGATGTNQSGPSKEQELLAAIQGANNKDELMAVIDSLGNDAGLFSPGMR